MTRIALTGKIGNVVKDIELGGFLGLLNEVREDLPEPRLQHALRGQPVPPLPDDGPEHQLPVGLCVLVVAQLVHPLGPRERVRRPRDDEGLPEMVSPPLLLMAQVQRRGDQYVRLRPHHSPSSMTNELKKKDGE